MSELDRDGQRLLDWLVERLRNAIPGRTGTYVSYQDAHDDLGLPLIGKTYGVSLQQQGLNSLAEWTKDTGKPGITGLIIDRKKEKPGSGYFELFDRSTGDRVWWHHEIRRSKEFDWLPFVSSSMRRKLSGGNSHLPSATSATPEAIDLPQPPPRIETQVFRVLRDTAIAKQVKRLHDYTCQLCQSTILLFDGTKYAEAHHITPLGGGHDGLDELGNLLCVCPTHHVLLDYGSIELRIGDLRTVPGHVVKAENVTYHNEKLLRRKG